MRPNWHGVADRPRGHLADRPVRAEALPGHPSSAYYRLGGARRGRRGRHQRLPHTVRVLLESLLRNAGGMHVREADVLALAALARRRRRPTRRCRSCRRACCCRTSPACPPSSTSPRCAPRWRAPGGDPARVDPLVPADLVIDHSVQVDAFGTRAPTRATSSASTSATASATRCCAGRRALRQLPRRAARHGHRPPGQPRVPRRASCSCARTRDGTVAFPDTLVGTDSHTTMINGLGVLGWGVGGIEAEAVMLGQPLLLRHADRRRRAVHRRAARRA